MNLLRLLFGIQNRGAAVGMVAVLVVLWLTSRRRGWILLMAAPVVVIGGVLFRISPFWQRFADIWERGPAATSAYIRLPIWRAAWQMLLDHPVFGVGPGNFSNLVQQYRPSLPENFVAHNNFLQVAAESGTLGLALYTALFAGAMVHLWRTRTLVGPDWPGPAARMILAGLVGYLAVGLFISRSNMVLAYILVGWAASLPRALPGGHAPPLRGPV
jgi:putative inorganic carbon (HCO3(-)) transporter